MMMAKDKYWSEMYYHLILMNRWFPLELIELDDYLVDLNRTKIIHVHWTIENLFYLLHLFVSVLQQLLEGVDQMILTKETNENSRWWWRTNQPWLLIGFESIIIEVFVSLSDSPSIFDSSACVSFESDLFSKGYELFCFQESKPIELSYSIRVSFSAHRPWF